MSEFKKRYNQNGPIYGISPKRKERIFELLGDTVNKKILDIGCNEGYLGAAIKMSDNEVVGVDINEQSIVKAKEVLDDAHVVNVLEEKIPYPDKYFDVIIMTEVIEHFLLPEDVMKEARRLLKDDGFIIITTPNFLFFANRKKILFGDFEYTESGFLDRGHVHFFQINSFEKMLKQLDLKVSVYNHVYADGIFGIIGKLNPKLFAYQIVAKVSKIKVCLKNKR